jgi:hypothetical protein
VPRTRPANRHGRRRYQRVIRWALAARQTKLQPEYRLGPLPHQIAVKKFEHGLFLREELIAGHHSGDDHIATAVEGEL